MDRQQVIAGIRLGRIIGAGATGVVHAGTVLATGQKVAVKLVRPQPGQPTKLVERTVQEGRVGWAVRHPNVVRVYEWGMAEGGAAYIVMERLEGETLAQQLLTRGRLQPDEAVSIARHIARGLGAIHAQGGVHRDVKPENVFLCSPPDDKIKLLDLGIVHLGENHPARLVRTGVGLVVGTLGYLSPEQARGTEIDARSDLYGLGATLYHALVGEPPHPEGDVVETLRHIALMTEPPPLPDDIPLPLVDLVKWLLAPSPAARPPDAAAVLAALDAVPVTVTDDDDDEDTRPVEQVQDVFPAMDEIAGQQQMRAGIIASVARAIRENGAPPELAADLAGLDRLKDRRRAAAARVLELRRQSTELAEDLDGRRLALEGTLAQLETAQAEVRERYMQSTAALMEIADSIEGIDRKYLRHYEQLDALLSDDPSPAADGPARSVPHCLAEMEALHQSRAFFADSQASVRTRMRTQHRAVSGINLQIIEIKRELLVVEAERQATLVGLEDAQRTADDEVLKLDREIEHQFLRLGFIVQAHQARRRMKATGASPIARSTHDPRPVDARAATLSADVRSVDIRPAEPRPAEARPAEARPAEQLPAKPMKGMRIVGRISRRSVNAAQRPASSAPPEPMHRPVPSGSPEPVPAAQVADRISLGRMPRKMPDAPPPEDDLGSQDTSADTTAPQAAMEDTAPHPPLDDIGPQASLADDTAPHGVLDAAPVDFEDDATSPERLPPEPPGGKRRRDTAELVSPEARPRTLLAGGALIEDRASLPADVWTSAEQGGKWSTDPDNNRAERRMTPRVNCSVRVEVRHGSQRALLTTRDLSIGGAFLFAPRLLTPGTAVELTLHAGDARLPLAGEVVHGRPGIGYAVRFDQTPDELEERLAAVVAAHAEKTAPGPTRPE